MKRDWVILTAIVVAGGLGGCAAKKAQAPAMEPLAAKPAEKNWVEKTGDATWNTVAAPIRGLGAQMKPKPKPALVPLTPTEPPELIIVTRGTRGVVTEEGAATEPKKLEPTTQASEAAGK